jgi:iron complex outermembrane receptor protein
MMITRNEESRRLSPTSPCSAGLLFTATVLAMSAQAEEESTRPQLEEVVVTARYRAESLSKAGISATAVNQELIQQSGIRDFADLARQVEGLSFANRGPGQNTPIIRGMFGAGGSNDALPVPQLVGTYFDDVPVNSPVPSQQDVPFYDLQRVEVLRGPQGTLYGEASMGGTIRYVSADPSLTEWDYRVNAMAGVTAHGDDNTAIDAALAMPLVKEHLGVRLVGYKRDDGGWIDQDIPGRKDVNAKHSKGGRVVVLGKPTEALTIRLFANVSDFDSPGDNLVTPPIDELRNSLRLFPYQRSDDARLYGARVSYEFGAGTLSYIAGRYERDWDNRSYDHAVTSILAPFVPIPGFALRNQLTNTDDVATHELRFVSDSDRSVSYVLGAFYKDAQWRSHGRDVEVGAGTNLLIYDSYVGLDDQQKAVFGEIYYRPFDALRLTGGVRYFQDQMASSNRNEVSLLFPVASLQTGSFELSEVLPKFGVEYNLNDDTLLYLNASKGARNGGPNNPAAVNELPEEERASASFFDKDSVWSYEIGAKTTLLDGDLRLSAAAFYNRWQDMQVNVDSPVLGLPYIRNASKAHTLGLEAAMQWRMLDWSTLTLNGTVLQAELDEPLDLDPFADTPHRVLPKGSRLPYVPQSTLNVTSDNIWSLSPDLDLHARLNYTYTGRREFGGLGQGFAVDPTRTGGYGLWNLSVGIESRRWDLTAFVQNATNKLVLYTDPTVEFGEGIVSQPRTIGLAVRIRP